MPVVVVFLGPSLPVAEAKEILSSATYLPPIKRGDLVNLLPLKPDIIIIIDGVFFQDAAVGHREILAILRAGIRVIGASSMGALRAVELEPFGMKGIGRVYEMYRDGVINSDDEVALICDPVFHTPQSVALVNIRVTLDAAVTAGVFSKADASEILTTAQRLYYPDRTYEKIISACREDLHTISSKKALMWLLANRIDQKKNDAIAALTYVNSLVA